MDLHHLSDYTEIAVSGSRFTYFFYRITDLFHALQEPTGILYLAKQIKEYALFLYNLSRCIDCCSFRTDLSRFTVRNFECYFGPVICRTKMIVLYISNSDP